MTTDLFTDLPWDNVTTPYPERNQNELLNTIIDDSQLALTGFGFLGNTGTIYTLTKNGQDFTPTIALLLKHQSFVDAIVCVFAAILLIQPTNWTTGVYAVDVVICHFWNGQAIYWSVAFVSAYNLICIAYERFLCVCKPFKFQDFTKSNIYRQWGIVYTLGLVCPFGAYFQVRLRDDGKCYSEYLWDGPTAETFFMAFSISTFITFYMIPSVFFVVFYGRVIRSFRKRQSQQMAASRVIDKATNELTKTAIVVTVVFLISFGYDLWYYLLGYTGLVDYVINSPLQKIGIWFSVFNSCANPFIYVALMPSYRRAVRLTFFVKCTKSELSEGGHGNRTSVATVAA